MSHLSIACLVALLLVVAPVWSQVTDVTANCLGDLNSVDADGDLRLTSAEFVSFVSLRSDGRMEFSSFSEMPLSLVAPYLFGACSCALTSSDDQCCVGENANISLDPVASEYSEDTLLTFCRSVDKSIRSILPATPVPTPAPTEPTPRPTAANELCITFQFGIVNTNGFDAAAIFNMVNNTLKTGLIIATENVTIDVLNASFPDARLLRYRNNEHSRVNIDEVNSFHVFPLDIIDSKIQDGLVLEGPVHGDRNLASYSDSQWRGGNSRITRRLVVYTQSLPPIILSIVDNDFCPSETPDKTKCQIVSAVTCVFLEEGDDRQGIRDVLSGGIQASIKSGEFEAAIPAEHRLI